MLALKINQGTSKYLLDPYGPVSSTALDGRQTCLIAQKQLDKEEGVTTLTTLVLFVRVQDLAYFKQINV